MKTRLLSRASEAAVVIALAVACAAPAFAADGADSSAADQAAAPQGQANAAQSEEVIVTAQRRDENLQSVPVSVTPVTGAALEARKFNDLTQLTKAAPSFQIDGQPAQARCSDASGAGACPTWEIALTDAASHTLVVSAEHYGDQSIPFTTTERIDDPGPDNCGACGPHIQSLSESAALDPLVS